MPQNATSNEHKKQQLRPQQLAALEALLTGSTVSQAAKAAGVSRETVHRWKRDDWVFQAAMNRGRKDLQQATQARLLTAAATAATNLSTAIEQGDLRASTDLLKGLGLLSGNPVPIGSVDPEVLQEEESLIQEEAESDRLTRSQSASFRKFTAGGPF